MYGLACVAHHSDKIKQKLGQVFYHAIKALFKLGGNPNQERLFKIVHGCSSAAFTDSYITFVNKTIEKTVT